MDRQEYPTMLATLQPAQAIDVLHDRVKQVGTLNAHIADWLAERKKIEEQYSSGLRKLARRPPPGDANELGVFSVPWHSLTSALESIADSHHAFAINIENDVEKPLRNFALQDRSMQAMSTIQGNLSSLARDIENAEKKNERLAHKGQKAKTVNVASASNDLETAQSQWDNQAPYVFEQLQAVDETRLNKLRDALTQFQTHEVDRIEKDRALAEQCLNVVLNVETTDEIKTFALRITQGRPAATPRRSSIRNTVAPSTNSLHAPPSHTADDAASQISDSAPVESEKRSGLKSLKRLGTVLGRRRESKAIFPPRGESPERRPKGNSAFNSFTGRLGRGRDASIPLDEADERSPRPSSPFRTMTASTQDPPPPIDGSAQSLAAAGMLSNGGSSNHQSYQSQQNNHGHQAEAAHLQAPLQPSSPKPTQPSISEPEAPKDSEGYSVPPSQLDPISQAERDAGTSSPAYHVNIRNAPIAEEGNDDVTLATLASTLKMGPPTTSRRAGTVRGRRDMRASVYAPSHLTPEAVAEEPSASNLTNREIDDAFSAAPASSQSNAPSSLPQINTSETQNRSVFPPPSATFPAPSASFSNPSSPVLSQGAAHSNDQHPALWAGSAAAVAANIFRPGSSVSQSMADHDNHSIRSGRSLSSSTSQGASKHPDLHEVGLNSSIIETVSAWFENGACTKSVVNGEVALAYNAVDFSTPSGQEVIRLEGFDKLEKVAPNPAFISDSASKGEYSINLAHLHKTNVAFKYKLAPTSSIAQGEQAPLKIHSSWKIDGSIAMCIVSYSLNPTFVLPHGTSSITLNNVNIVLHLGAEGAKAQTCQSKPVGVFDRSRNLCRWKLGDLVLNSTTETKLLAKFTTLEAQQVTPGSVEARWEMHASGSAATTGSGLAVHVKDNTSAAGGAEADPFADAEERPSTSDEEASWKLVQGPKTIVAGVYTAQS